MESTPPLRPTWQQLIATWVVFGACELAMAACWFEIARLQRDQPSQLAAVPGILVCSLLPAIFAFFQYRATYQRDREAATTISGVLGVFAGILSGGVLLVPAAIDGIGDSAYPPIVFLTVYGFGYMLLLLVLAANWSWSSQLKKQTVETKPPPFQWSLFTAFGLMTLFALQFALASIGLRFVSH
jgi:hypothetical protein